MDHCAICIEEINLKDLKTKLAMNDENHNEILACVSYDMHVRMAAKMP